MINFKLANILISPDGFTDQYPELRYRVLGERKLEDKVAPTNAIDATGEANRSTPTYTTSTNSTTFCPENQALKFSGGVDFATYFNGFSLEKWRHYTVVDEVYLHLELQGDSCDIFVSSLFKPGNDSPTQDYKTLGVFAGNTEFESFDFKLPNSEAVIASFALNSRGITFVRNAYYYAHVDESLVRPVRLALSTTTFRKEEYIIPNIELIRREVIECDDPVADGFELFVVDNGRTLDADALQGSHVRIIPNDNVGGAGGFARGMIEALHCDMTHVLLMDDDVRMNPESIKRTFALLSLRNDAYEHAFLNGAMLMLNQPNCQFEDVAFVDPSGYYCRVKPNLYIDRAQDIVKNELIDVEVENAYGAWWYCCIPTSAIRDKGLPLPVFVRCDDVEFGVRCQPTIMSMNGICVWHESFEGRWRAAIDCYQYTRNFLILIAVDGKSSEAYFMLRFCRSFRQHLRMLNYGAAELLLDGLEDYLKGPSFIAQPFGEKLLKQNSSKSERLVPLSELDPAVVAAFNGDTSGFGQPVRRSFFFKMLCFLPFDAHALPDALLKNEPASAYYCETPSARTSRRRRLLAVDLEGKNGNVRELNRARYRALVKRYREVMTTYRKERKHVAQAYRDAMPWLTSEEFWNEYLGLA